MDITVTTELCIAAANVDVRQLYVLLSSFAWICFVILCFNNVSDLIL